MEIKVYYLRPNFWGDNEDGLTHFGTRTPIAKEDCVIKPYYAGIINSKFVPRMAEEFEEFFDILNWTCWGAEINEQGIVHTNEYTYAPAINPLTKQHFGHCNNEMIFEYTSQTGRTWYIAHIELAASGTPYHNRHGYDVFTDFESAALYAASNYEVHKKRFIGRNELCKLVTTL